MVLYTVKVFKKRLAISVGNIRVRFRVLTVIDAAISQKISKHDK